MIVCATYCLVLIKKKILLGVKYVVVLGVNFVEKVYQKNEFESHYNNCEKFKKLLDNVIKELSKPDLFMERVKEDEE